MLLYANAKSDVVKLLVLSNHNFKKKWRKVNEGAEDPPLLSRGLTQIDVLSRGPLAGPELTFKKDWTLDKNMQEQFVDAWDSRSSGVVSRTSSGTITDVLVAQRKAVCC